MDHKKAIDIFSSIFFFLTKSRRPKSPANLSKTDGFYLPKYSLISSIRPIWSTPNGHRRLQCPHRMQSPACSSRLR